MFAIKKIKIMTKKKRRYENFYDHIDLNKLRL